MCKVIDFLKKELVVSRVDAENGKDLIEKLAARIERERGLDAGRIVDAVLEREKYGTTGIGNGVAIPHGRIRGIKDIVLLVATTENPVEYGSVDGEGVRLVFMLIVPEGNNLLYLKLLSQISIICNDKSIRSELISAESTEDLIRIIEELD